MADAVGGEATRLREPTPPIEYDEWVSRVGAAEPEPEVAEPEPEADARADNPEAESAVEPTVEEPVVGRRTSPRKKARS